MEFKWVNYKNSKYKYCGSYGTRKSICYSSGIPGEIYQIWHNKTTGFYETYLGGNNGTKSKSLREIKSICKVLILKNYTKDLKRRLKELESINWKNYIKNTNKRIRGLRNKLECINGI